jgi:2-oxoglutarate dehydrogenase E2 component (dihydrolipoamide succinyltransferase)
VRPAEPAHAEAPPPAPPQAPPPQAAPEQPEPQAAAAEVPPHAEPQQEAPQQEAAYPAAGAAPATEDGSVPLISGTDGPYVTPLVRKLAAEHGIDLGSVAGTGVGGRIRKQDVIDAARALRGPGAVPAPSQPGQPPAAAAASPAVPQARPAAAPSAAAPPAAGPAAVTGAAASQAAAPATAAAYGQEADQAPGRPSIVPSSLRGTTEHMSRARQVIAKRMVESLQTSAQLTTVVEADVTAIARLRDRAKADFEAREGVKLSFLPFFALAAVEALKVHPRLNAVIDTASAQVTYHDAEHLGIAVDTDRGLMVPVIRKAGDLNIAGLARKIADLAERTRAGRVSPDDLSGGTFTLTNTGSRGALFDTPIINQPQVAILGTGTVVKRPVVVEDAALGEVITVRSMVYLALTYDHRLVDGADAARFLITLKSRLEEGAFETELGL